MELSGLIFVALALVWAVVLIPKALRHHDEVARTRSVADLSDGVRVVARRSGATAVPDAPPRRAPATTPRRAPATAPLRAPVTAPRRAAAVAASRRRRILAVLLLADLAVVAAAVTGVLAPWAPAAPVALTLAFLLVARVTVRRDRARRQRASRPGPTAAPVGTPQPAPMVPAAAGYPAEPAPDVATAPADQRNEQGLSVVSGLDDTSSIPVVRVEDGDSAGSLWDPLPVTLPTYVTKPRASRSIRTIDLTAPDVSSSGRSSAASALVADAASTGTAPDATKDARRAVGS